MLLLTPGLCQLNMSEQNQTVPIYSLGIWIMHIWPAAYQVCACWMNSDIMTMIAILDLLLI